MNRNISALILSLLFITCLVTSLSAVQICAGVLILFALFSRRAPSSAPRTLLYVAVLYIGALFLIILVANGITAAALSLKRTWMILPAPAVAHLFARLDAKGNRLAGNLFITGAVVSAALFLLQYLFGDPYLDGRYSFHRSPYAASFLMMPAIFMVLALPKLYLRHAATIMLVFISMLLINVRASIIAWGIGAVAALLVTRFERTFARRIAVIAAMVVILIGSLAGFERWNVFNIHKHVSMIDRFVIWAQALDQIRERPLLGHGFDKFETDPTKTSPEYYEFAINEMNPHNSYLMIFHAAGLCGYFVLWAVLAWTLKLLHEKIRERNNRWALTAYAYTAGLLFAAFFDKTFFVSQVTLLQWFLVGAAMGSDERGEETK